jgi:hypothetical protein
MIVVSALLVLPAAALAGGTLPSSWQRGMNFTSWTSGGYGSSAAKDNLRKLAALGTDRVVLTPTWYMDTASSNGIARDDAKTPTDDALRTVIGEAHSLGMAVTLKPHVDVRDGTFRGEIAPTDPAAWFASYDRMLLGYATLAQTTGADTLVVGTELTSMTTDAGPWTTLISAVRGRFEGQLTYAANWVDGAETVPFWNQLDAIGIDAYMPLETGSATPTVDQVAAAWQPYLQRITDLHARTGKPVEFTELGYQSRTDALDHPASASGSPDARLQAVAYAAALRVWSAVPWFQGISWWNWEAEPTGEDPAGSFSIAGKPAAAVLRTAQGATAVTPGVDRSGATVPTGAGVLILIMAAFAGLMVALRRRRPPEPQAPQRPQSPTPLAPVLAPVTPVHRPVLNLVEAAPAPSLAHRGLSPAPRESWGGALPPQLAAACMVPSAMATPAAPTRLPSRYQGMAA